MAGRPWVISAAAAASDHVGLAVCTVVVMGAMCVPAIAGVLRRVLHAGRADRRGGGRWPYVSIICVACSD
eukprot:COSAG01_NODE_3457_length_6072_cov_14.110330_8_plen_70_part_00